MVCILHPSHNDICTAEVLPCQLEWVHSILTWPFSILECQGQELTILQILSSVHSYPPDFLYQNALASVGIEAFGEHVSKTWVTKQAD